MIFVANVSRYCADSPCCDSSAEKRPFLCSINQVLEISAVCMCVSLCVCLGRVTYFSAIMNQQAQVSTVLNKKNFLQFFLLPSRLGVMMLRHLSCRELPAGAERKQNKMKAIFTVCRQVVKKTNGLHDSRTRHRRTEDKNCSSCTITENTVMQGVIKVLPISPCFFLLFLHFFCSHCGAFS